MAFFHTPPSFVTVRTRIMQTPERGALLEQQPLDAPLLECSDGDDDWTDYEAAAPRADALPERAGNVFWGLPHMRSKHSPRPAHASYGSTLSQIFPSTWWGRRNSAAALHPVGYRSVAPAAHKSTDTLVPQSPVHARSMFVQAFRPTNNAIDGVLDSWPRRNFVLVVIPVVLVLIWCGMPFPKSDLHRHGSNSELRVDANFWFFLIWYYGLYVAVALIYVTQLFTLYRLNWWPKALGAKTSYAVFWCLSLVCGYLLHRMSPLGKRHWKHGDVFDDPDVQLQLKTEWVLLAFATMAIPACVCFIGLRRNGRHRVPGVQRAFLLGSPQHFIPSSYRRFLWFVGAMAIALFTLLLGQAYAIAFLGSLPHTGTDGTFYVVVWMLTVHLLSGSTQWIMVEKVRSRTLLFVFKYYYFMVYFIFYRNLFARLRSFDQFALVQLVSSLWVCLWYPLTMSRAWFQLTNKFISRLVSWEEHKDRVALFFYLRHLVQHTTMAAFIGWLSILHFGINQPLYPFFAFDDRNDPYNYRLTVLGSLAIWASEIVSVWLAALICKLLYGIHVVYVGLEEMRMYPETVPTLVWTSLHVLMNMLFFLIKLNFA